MAPDERPDPASKAAFRPVAATAAAVTFLLWPREQEPASMKIEIDAVARATPRRLAAPLQITDVQTHEALQLDPARQQEGRLSYQLSKPAWVRIRLIARRNRELVLRTLVDWSARDLGRNEETWDGRDASGYRVDQRRCPCRFMIEGDDARHAAHARAECGDPSLRVMAPRPGAVVRGSTALRLACANRSRGPGCTLRIYVDYEPVAAVPASGAPAWDWDTATVPTGRHLVTFNLDDGRDHIGTASVEVEVVR